MKLYKMNPPLELKPGAAENKATPEIKFSINIKQQLSLSYGDLEPKTARKKESST